jgi:3-oxoacyl-[acyl-carrier protein] reductase
MMMNESVDKANRVVLITGGSKGIGRAIALKFAEEEATLILVHYDPDDKASQETMELLKERGVKAESHRVDVSQYADTEALVNGVLERYGRIDTLINNAGIYRDSLLMRMTEETWDAVIRVNLKSVYNCSRLVLRSMVKAKKGRIVSISSIAGQIGNPGQANYAASKAGIIGFTKTVAQEVAKRGITVNAVAPGFIKTEMTEALPEKIKEQIQAQIPSGVIGEAKDVAEVVFWLCSDAARYITGQVIHVNGGLFM